MPNHRVSQGDSLERLAKFYYEDERAARALGVANALNHSAPLTPGIELSLPRRLVGLDGMRDRQKMSSKALMGVFELRPDLLFVRIHEERFGTVANSVDMLRGKWLYVASEGAVVARVEAANDGLWSAQNQLFELQRSAADQRLVLLAGRDYRYLLSPYELTARAERRFAAQAHKAWRAEQRNESPEDRSSQEWTVLVRDSYQWALDVHQHSYLPALDPIGEWLAEHADKLFIASTLKCLIDAKDARWYSDPVDPLSLADDLNPGEPQHYLEQVYKKGFDERRLKAEQAMAQVLRIVESEEHRCIEASALEQGGPALELTTLMWASVLARANESDPGRRLLYTLAQDAGRFPLSYVLTSGAAANELEFAQYRYLSNAAVAIVKDLAPAWLELHQARGARANLHQLAGFLERAAGAKVDVLEKSFDQMHKNALGGIELTTDVKYKQTTRLVLEGTPGYLEALRAAKEGEVPTPPATIVKCEKLFSTLIECIKLPLTLARGAIEVINFANGYNELVAKRTGRKWVGFAGAAADLAALMVELGGPLLASAKQAAVKQVFAAGFGFVSGICDCIEFGSLAAESAGRHDYDSAVGGSVAAGGALLMSGGSLLALSGVAAGATLTETAALGALAGASPLGPAVAAKVGACISIVGTALVFGGALWWRLASDNEYEQFAKHCFLGRRYRAVRNKFTWTSVYLPTDNGRDEKQALRHLISGFHVALEQKPLRPLLTPHRLTICPGFYEEGDVFEIYFEHAFYPGMRFKRRVSALLKLDLRAGRLIQVSGERLNPQLEVVRNQGRVERVYITETYADPALGESSLCIGRIARVRLATESDGYIPDDGRWVEVHVFEKEGDELGSATSSDLSRRAGSIAAPFLTLDPT